jgi:hypothetical protein
MALLLSFFPISYWVGPPEETPSRYAELADCGFTVTWRGDPDLSAQFGMKCLVADARVDAALANWNDHTASDLDAAVDAWKDHPAFYGFYLRDEPNASDFPALARVNRRILERAPESVPYINLFPTYANSEQLGTETYEEHVQRFMSEVRPRVLSYDHYALRRDGERPDYFRNMEVIRDAGLQHNTPFWFILLTTPHYGYRNPSEADIRWQVYTALAYGAKGIMYFTYMTPRYEDFQNGILDRDGNRTEHYEVVRQVNGEIHALAPTLNRLKSVAVAHSEPVPDGAEPLAADSYLRSVQGGEWVVGFLTDDHDCTYLFLVNRNLRASATLELAFDASVRGVEPVPRGNATDVPVTFTEGRASVSLAAGDGTLLRVAR